MKNRKILALMLVFAMLFSMMASAASYTVVSGDVLWKIAKNHGTTWQALAEHNKLKNPNLIYTGQKLDIPSGGATPVPTPAPAPTAKTASGTANGYVGDVKVDVTLDGGKIIAVKVTSHNETAGIGTNAVDKIPSEIVSKQTIDLDAVAGATFTTDAILNATKAALVSLGADMSKFTSKTTSASKETFKQTADVVIIGSGGAGMSAAVEALSAGSSVVVIEKMPTVGGNTKTAGSQYNTSNEALQKNQKMGASEVSRIENILKLEAKNPMMQNWLGTLKKEFDAYKASGSTYLFDSPSLHKLQTYLDGDYVANPELINIMGDNSLAGVDFLSGLGAKWIPTVTAAVGATWTRSLTPTKDWGNAGSAFVLPQEKYVRDNKGTILCNFKADEIIMENGRAVGVKGTQTDGTPFEIRANKGVIVATGGFAANVEMRQKYNKFWADLGPDIRTSNGPWATGDGIVMAEKIGASLVGMEWIQMVPGFTTFHPAIDDTILINKNGERFVKEDGRRDEISSAILKQGGIGTSFGIVDAHTVYDLLGGISSNGQTVDQMIAAKSVVKFDTLEDAAKALGINEANLLKTVSDFNKTVETRTPDPLGRTVFNNKLDKAPYFFSFATAVVHHTMGGIEINTSAEVLGSNGKIIPGLYAAGEVTGGIHGANRLGGNAITDITVFGRIAGQSAAASK